MTAACWPGINRNWHPSHDADTSLDVLPDAHGHVSALWQPQIHPRTEPDQPDAFAPRHRIPRLFPGDHPPGHPTSDLLKNQLAVLAGEGKDVLLVFERCRFRPASQELSRLVVKTRDGACRRGAVHVN